MRWRHMALKTLQRTRARIINALCVLALPYVKRRLRKALATERSWSEWIAFIRAYHRSLPLPPRLRARYRCRLLQVDTEIETLLELVAELRPRRVLEIGTDQGGTLFLLSRAAAPDARLISVDLPTGPAAWRDHLYRSFGAPAQTIHIVRMDSHSYQTLQHICQLLAGGPVDVLLIDGDHSFTGVTADYELYAPLVREGGLIAFHDIQPDHRTLFGPEFFKGNDAGDVHRLWKEIKHRHSDTLEIIQSTEQDGYGIGVIRT